MKFRLLCVWGAIFTFNCLGAPEQDPIVGLKGSVDEQPVLGDVDNAKIYDFMGKAYKGDLSGVMQSVTDGVDVNAQTKNNRVTALTYAAEFGYMDMARFLIGKGAKVDLRQ